MRIPFFSLLPVKENIQTTRACLEFAEELFTKSSLWDITGGLLCRFIYGADIGCQGDGILSGMEDKDVAIHTQVNIVVHVHAITTNEFQANIFKGLLACQEVRLAI